MCSRGKRVRVPLGTDRQGVIPGHLTGQGRLLGLPGD